MFQHLFSNLIHIKNIAITLFLLLLLVGCSDKTSTTEVLIDNPTDKAMVILYDQEKLEIPALSYLKKEMTFGPHTLSFVEGEFHPSIDKQILPFFINPSALKTFNFNPSGQVYVYAKEYYGEGHIPEPATFNLAGYAYEDDVSLINNFSFPTIQDYGIHEAFPEILETNADFKMLTKLFRTADYDKYYRESWGLVPTKTDVPDSLSQNNKKFLSFSQPFQTSFDTSDYNDRPEFKALLDEYIEAILLASKAYETKGQFKDAQSKIHRISLKFDELSDYSSADSNYVNSLISVSSVEGKNSVSRFHTDFIFFETKPYTSN